MYQKIYDCFPFFNEFELLKIRFEELYQTVDAFIITEATLTHSGKPKPLYLQENLHLFDKYKNKIIIETVEYNQNFKDPWHRERHQRDSATNVLNKILRDEDFVIISDCDEIPNVEAIHKHVSANTEKVGILQQKRYMYFLNNLNISTDEPQSNSRIVLGKTMRSRSLSPCAIRYCDKYNLCEYYDIPNGGWHFTFMGGADKVIEKIKSFAHTEYDIDSKTNRDVVLANIEKNKDVYNCNSTWEIVAIDDSFPKLVKENQQEYIQKNMIKNINSTVKFYDCFIFNDELDLLEVRLEELNSKIDFFVIVEAESTHQGAPKKLHFAENKNRYKKFLHKIIHVTIRTFPKHDNDFVQPYMNEYYQRNKIVEALKGCHEDDMIIISDVDEIINPDKIAIYDTVHSFEQKLFYFDLTTFSNEIWDKPKILPYKELKNRFNCDINWEFRNLSCPTIKDGGWHLSYFGGANSVSKKLKEFSHAEINKTPDWYVLDCIINKRRIHDSHQLLKNEDFENIPEYCKKNKIKFAQFFDATDIHTKLRIADANMYDELFVHDVYAMTINDYKDATVIDIGGNVGCFAQRAIELGAKIVHCFEPEFINHGKLINNLSQESKVKIYNYAVADPSQKLVYMQRQGPEANIYGEKQNADDKSAAVCLSLQHIIDLIGREDLIVKIDCEGAEFDILFSLTREYYDKISLLNVEFHDEVNPKYKNQTKNLIDYIKQFGFHIDHTGPLAGMWYANGVFVPSPISMHRFRKTKI